MNVDDDIKEPVTDLRLSLDSSNQSTAHSFDNSGAGANAASRIDIAFVASDHLTELVWSPRKGLGIKCTTCSTTAEESSHMLAMGMGSKATSANQADELKVVTAVTSSKSSGRYVRVGITCQSDYTHVIKDSRCNSSPCFQDVLKRHASPVNSMRKVSSRKKSFCTVSKDKNLCPPEKREQSRLCMASNIGDFNQSSTSITEDIQKGAFKKQDLSADDDGSVFKDKSHQGEGSPNEGKINEYIRKGKAKVLSDAYVEHGEEESRGSKESCSSAGSFCSRQRKRSLEQQFTNESKRIKTTFQQTGPKSLVSGSSSFISWISNMTKGINKANKDGTPRLALTLTPSGPQNENHEWELIPHRNNDKYLCQRMGFPSIFRSIYCTSSKIHGQPAITDEHQKNGEPFDACIGNSMVDVVPLSMREMTSSSCKGDQSSGNGERQLKLRKVLPIDDNREHTSSEKGASCNLLTKAGSIKLSAPNSLPDQFRTQNNDSSPPRKINASLASVLDPFQSFWITRFSPKSPVPKPDTDNHDQILLVDNQTRNSKNNIFRSSEVRKVVLAKGESIKDLNKLASGQRDEASSGSDASVGPKEGADFITQTFDSNFDQIFITKGLKSSDAMASMFARRLDAIKHMTPAGITGNASGVGTTCFYCGKKGHSLRNCSKFAENKLEGLWDSIGFPDSSEKLPYLCIQCFQLGHLATDCQSTPCNNAVCGPLATPNNEFLETPGDRSNEELLLDNKDTRTADIPPTPCNQNNPKPDPELYVPLPNSIGRVSLDIPKGYFDAVRLLRLSRRKILKLMDSQMELSNLEGFFLRLRIGNMEQGHGGTGYHVAYIDGLQSEESCRGSKFILPVNMGSIKILVGSRSISNQEFLEDELMAWWSATVETGRKLPTQEELNDKLQQRNKLQL